MSLTDELKTVMALLGDGNSAEQQSDTTTAGKDQLKSANELSLERLSTDAQLKKYVDSIILAKGDNIKPTLVPSHSDTGNEAKVEQLALVVKNLIEVNKLAYMDLNRRVSSLTPN